MKISTCFSALRGASRKAPKKLPNGQTKRSTDKKYPVNAPLQTFMAILGSTFF
jgi:hypothetical protein